MDEDTIEAALASAPKEERDFVLSSLLAGLDIQRGPGKFFNYKMKVIVRHGIDFECLWNGLCLANDRL